MPLANWKPVFLAALQESPNVSRAARAADISRTGARKARETDPEFAAAWDEAIESSMDDLEEEAYKRAKHESDTLAIFFLKTRRREVYGEKLTIEHARATPHAIPESDHRLEGGDEHPAVESDPQPDPAP
jgi:hypothetical protein